MSNPAALHALAQALEKAKEFRGATSPNPPVGAAAIDAQGRILSVEAHEKAGTGHAEARVLKDLAERGLTTQMDTLVITLEPCNHHGRTPPCTEAILKSGVRRVVYGATDPNPQVAGQGAKRLAEAGIEALLCSDPLLRAECEELIRPFAHWAKTGLPWIVIKTAHLIDPLSNSYDSLRATMIPPPGQKTFTSAESLKFAHALRRRADAIMTGSGTILADWPEFTVRHVRDHDLVSRGEKKRWLVVLDRRGRTPAEWIEEARARGFEVLVRPDFEAAIRELGGLGALETLVEAGPALSADLLSQSHWDQHVITTQGQPDQIRIEENVHRNHSKSRDPHAS
jgi:diaminohydroxyphosphoribosylaminopyrimidine deaminase/5-amino-6-(5-phosphoribosylamino)uracil reductase